MPPGPGQVKRRSRRARLPGGTAGAPTREQVVLDTLAEREQAREGRRARVSVRHVDLHLIAERQVEVLILVRRAPVPGAAGGRFRDVVRIREQEGPAETCVPIAEQELLHARLS